MEHAAIAELAAVGAAALVAQWLAWKTRLPAILYLLAAGVLLGPVAHFLEPDALFGDLLFPVVSLSVAVILFEGSLTLEHGELRGHGSVVRNLVTLGCLVTWLVAGAAAYWILGLEGPIAALFGAIMVVTGPTVIVPMVRAARPNARVANILRWEGILIDPIGAILAVVTFNLLVATRFEEALGDALGVLARMVAAGFVFGAVAGWAWGRVLRALLVPDFLVNVATLLVVFVVFAAADMIESESGLLAVTVMGIWLANMKGVHVDEILQFKESLSLLLISGLFILLAARLGIGEILALGWPALGVLAVLQFVARPLGVALCAIGSPLTWQERAALGWIAPRGIVAAAISALFALRLEAEGFAGAAALVPLTFVAIVGTVIFQSVTARPVLKLLGVAAPPPEGVVIAGAGPVARAIGEVLHEHEVPVVIADTVWDGVRRARMAGLRSYLGNPASDHASRHLDLTGIGRMFALSRRSDFNDLVCAHFADTFGRESVYTLPLSLEDDDRRADKFALRAARRGRRLFSADVSLAKLGSLLAQGAEIRVTPLTEAYGFDALCGREASGTLIPLFAWNERGQMRPFTADSDWKPGPGWRVAVLTDAPPPANKRREAGDAQSEESPGGDAGATAPAS